MESLTDQTSFSNRESRTYYDCLEWLGAGGMSEVFLGIQRGTKDFNRLVVIKKMLGRPANAENFDTVKILTREARYIAQLNHPFIVKVFDLAAYDQNLVITMEYVEGETLRSIISSLINAKKRFPIPILCRLISDAAEALHYVHHATGPDGEPLGLVHHDIDTNNLMVETSGHIKLIDFGVASSSRYPDETMSDVVAGKLTFTAPEVFVCSDQTDPRSDVYSLGIVLYIMATLNKPYQFTDESIEARIRRVISEPVPVISNTNSEIPPELNAIIVSATQKNRDKRLQSAEHFADAIERFASQQGGMATNQEVKRWLFDVCSEKIERRRDWVRGVMGNARIAVNEIDARKTDLTNAERLLPISNRASDKSEHAPVQLETNLDPDPSHILTGLKVFFDRKMPLRSIGAHIFANRKRRITYLSAVAASILFAALVWHSASGYSQASKFAPAPPVQPRLPYTADWSQTEVTCHYGADKASVDYAYADKVSIVSLGVAVPASSKVKPGTRSRKQSSLGRSTRYPVLISHFKRSHED